MFKYDLENTRLTGNTTFRASRGIRYHLASTLFGALTLFAFSSGATQACSVAAGQLGVASYYGPGMQGGRTASGETFDMHGISAASPCLPLGTKIRVTVVDTGRSLVVTVNDRMPSRRRVLDLSMGAARQLGIINRGTAMVFLAPS